jgi:hypothetical protein
LPELTVCRVTQEGELEEPEKGVAPTWGRLVKPLERITDRLELIWGHGLSSTPMLSLMRTATVNVVMVELSSVFHDYDVMGLDLSFTEIDLVLRVFLFLKTNFYAD